MDSERRVHPDCINASNTYHECVECCFKKIAEAKAVLEKQGLAETVGGQGCTNAKAHTNVRESLDDKRVEEESSEEEEDEVDVTQLTGRKKKLFELRLKMGTYIPKTKTQFSGNKTDVIMESSKDDQEDALLVPVGQMTRTRSKQLKDAPNRLIGELMDKESIQ